MDEWKLPSLTAVGATGGRKGARFPCEGSHQRVRQKYRCQGSFRCWASPEPKVLRWRRVWEGRAGSGEVGGTGSGWGKVTDTFCKGSPPPHRQESAESKDDLCPRSQRKRRGIKASRLGMKTWVRASPVGRVWTLQRLQHAGSAGLWCGPWLHEACQLKLRSKPTVRLEKLHIETDSGARLLTGSLSYGITVTCTVKGNRHTWSGEYFHWAYVNTY